MTAEPVNGEVYVAIHPHAVSLHRVHPEGSPRNVWRGRVDGTDLLGDRVRVHLDRRAPDRRRGHGRRALRARAPRRLRALGQRQGHRGRRLSRVSLRDRDPAAGAGNASHERVNAFTWAASAGNDAGAR